MPHDTPPPPSSSVLSALRAGTQTLHVALEKRLPFFSERLDLECYKQLLAAYYGFYQPLESNLLACTLPDGFELSTRLKTPALRQDLRALNVHIPSLPVCDTLPPLDHPASVLGVLYVLEGATLGGNVLRKHLFEQLGLDTDNGCAFLYVYGQATGMQWKAFLDFLGSVPLDAPSRALVVHAACSTFSCFEQWLERQEVLL